MRETWQLSKFGWDIWRSSRSNTAVSALRQQARLRDLVEFARARAPFYQQHYCRLPMGRSDLHFLPPVTKSELMAHFDDWVTDSSVTRAGVADFLAQKSLVGQHYLGRYTVWSTSGVTGQPGIFVHDTHALAVYSALITVRGYRWLTPARLWGLLRGSGRYVLIAATGEHFTLTDYMERVRRISSQAALRIRPFSALTPLSELVQSFNGFQPAVLVGYPSIMQLLAQEQETGYLQIAPVLVSTGGECLAAGARADSKRFWLPSGSTCNWLAIGKWLVRLNECSINGKLFVS